MRMNHIQITAQAVAEAIAIERERCAQIADSMNSTQNIGDRIRYGLGNEVAGRKDTEGMMMEHIQITAQAVAEAIAVERKRCAVLVEAMMDEKPWKDQLWSRTALAIAGRAIRRGRHLTEEERLKNLADAMEDAPGDTPEERAENAKAVKIIRGMAERSGHTETAGQS